MGIAELEEYIAGLDGEIARARVEIAAKQTAAQRRRSAVQTLEFTGC